MANFLYNQKILKDRRSELRKNQTEPEKVLWKHLNKNQISDLRFFRQYSVGPYILDFYCPKVRLSVEIDGKSHQETDTKIYDQERTQFLKGHNIREIRFKNEEVMTNIDRVIKKIKGTITP